MTKIGINGFGRIGRNTFRAILDHPELEVVAVNDLTDPETLVHLLTYDSVHGTLDASIEVTESGFMVDGKLVQVSQESDPSQIDWNRHGVEIVIESTGRFTQRSKASEHLQAGVKKVILSAPSKDADVTLVMGVNQDQYDADKHQVISNASCTTNCMALIAKVLHDRFGLEHGLMTTVHAFTNDQRLLDLPHRDLRRARAATESIIPTTTGAAKAVAQVMPELEGRLNGMAIRVPVKNVSLIDFVATLEKKVSTEEVNQVFQQEAAERLQGLLEYTEKPLVSSDYIGNPNSSVIDGLSTMELDGNMIKVIAWYDNEWAYSSRLVDLAEYVSS